MSGRRWTVDGDGGWCVSGLRSLLAHWFAETLTVWLKFAELNDEAMKFAATNENYRVVLSNLVERLSKLLMNDEKITEIWKFIDSISTELNLTLPRYTESVPKEDFMKHFKELKTKVDALTMK